MSKKPLISIVLPTHNRPELLNEAIESVCRQTLQDYELIIVDDASDSVVKASELKKQFNISRLKVSRNSVSQGGAESKNIGVSLANGRYITFLDDDDKLAPEYLQQAINLLESEADIELVFMGVAWFGANALRGENNYNAAITTIFDIAKPYYCQNHYYMFEHRLTFALLEAIPMAFQRPVTSLKKFHAVGNYDKDCFLWDCDWALRASVQAKCALITEGLYCQRVDNQGYSSANRDLEQIHSAIYFKEKFYTEIKRTNNKALQQSVKKVLAKNWFDVAYFVKKDNKAEALKAWYKSQRYNLDLKRFKFLFFLVLY
ncbi:MAG TPA: glycosyltransferase [Aeromonadales bacterium]|nr:glycosyltransferase [Aeromonadales bacterium]